MFLPLFLFFFLCLILFHTFYTSKYIHALKNKKRVLESRERKVKINYISILPPSFFLFLFFIFLFYFFYLSSPMHHLTPIERASSPVFPLERGSDVSINAEPLKHSTHIQLFIKLVEPVIFIQGFESHHIGERPPSILRGSLIIRILKPTKLKRIALNFKGFSRTEWPEGIPPKKQEFLEINDIVNHTWPFYQHKSKFVTLGR